VRTVTKADDRDEFMFDAAAEKMPRAELAALQSSRVREVIERAYANVRQYRQKFDAAGVKPADFKRLEDLARFPFTLKADLRDTYPFGMFAVPPGDLRRIHASSGTTGKPTVVGYTRGDLDCWADLMARSLACAGARPGDIVHNAYGYGLFTGGLGAHYGAERLGCAVVPVSGGGTERQVTLLTDFGASVLCATPSYALNIAEVAAGMGVDLRRSKLRIGVFGAEPWSEGMRRDLQEQLGLKAVDIYGLSEILGPGVAAECGVAQAGLHGWEDHFLFEVIDAETLQPLPMGATGELVVTTLTKEALPMIRYRTRDLTRLLPPTARSMRRIEKITGRSDDMLIIRGVNVFPTQIEELILKQDALVPHYQLEISRPQVLDEMVVVVERSPASGSMEGDAAGAKLAHLVKAMIGVTAEVRVVAPGSIERSLGKAKRVIDKRPKG